MTAIDTALILLNTIVEKTSEIESLETYKKLKEISIYVTNNLSIKNLLFLLDEIYITITKELYTESFYIALNNIEKGLKILNSPDVYLDR
jgi:hypothetical protein